MLGMLSNYWNQAGVNSTLVKLGYNKQEARAITASIPDWSWSMFNDCTKGLKVPNNLCNTMFALTMYVNFQDSTVSMHELHEDIQYAFKNLQAALDYQCEMGFKEHVYESQRRFEYAAKMHFDFLSA
jgi:hypothetical protein